MEQEVRSVYQRMVSVMLDFTDIKDLEKVVHPDFMGYGSAAHEFFKTREDLKKMAQIQKDQLEGQEFWYERKLVSEKIFAGGNSCLIVEEFDLFFPGNDHHLLLRLSSLLEQIDGAWLVTHVHGSTPDSNIAEEEAFPEQGLRMKNEQLEAKIRERTRELEIEAALERTRAQSLQMQHSSELNEVSKVFHEQLQALGIASAFSFVWLPDEKAGDHLFWATWTVPSKEGTEIHTRAITYPLDKTEPYTAACFADWESGVPVHEHFVPPEDLDTFFASWEELLKGASKLNPKHFPEGIYYTEAFIEYGCFGIDTREPLTEEEKSILHRFAIEFERTYTRFLELKKAEAQAKEAEIEVALERVRSRTMAMQHSDELAEASHLLDKEVRSLGVKTWGCAFNIYRENDSIEWFGNEAGLLPTYTVPRQGIFKEYYDRGQKGESLYIKEIAGESCIAHYEYMSTLPVVGDVLKQLKETNGSFPSYQIDHVVYFKYGYLLFITREAVPEAHDIFKRFARVFEQTYTRFLDLQLKEEQAVKLVEEKQRLENTLADLQATQRQLVHAEKMASLGELTAGIAHEIQNPLNFVNNFSEVSRELLEEMIGEFKKGDTEEVDAIARDVIQNLEKIVHHGQRADSIVKGMLQHSRSGDGKKEPTNLNAVADEYFRLAYHGLRAKEKSFNATMETEFDPDLPLVNVVPQDVGRVLLNLITNAFHAVSERMQEEKEGYKPTVWVKTKKTTDGVEIAVQDNGGGIPENIREKIFQPFFTTKPTGEGTGLGLSMSYDIVNKGHGGELTMVTTVGEGTVFKIVLPATPEKA